MKLLCYRKFGDFISSEDDIFLISNYDLDKWDFSWFIEVIYILFLNVLISLLKGILKRKVEVFKRWMIYVVGVIVLIVVILVFGLFIVDDVVFVFNEVRKYKV